MEVPGIDESKEAESHMTSAAAFVEGGTQEACDDACSICLEAFCESDPSTVTNCKHEFHLQCILEWCQRSSNCPMCWQSISLKDDSSQELLEAVERERSFRFSPWQHSTIFHHPTLGDFELQHLPVGANDAELEERIIQHLAAAAAMGSARHIARRESPRSRSSFFSDQSTVSNQDRAGPSDILSISESLKSRFNAMSMRYKESLSKSTKGWREKLFSRNTSMADLGSEVQREVNAGIASVSRIMEHLETRDNSRGDGASASRTQAGPSITEQNNQNNVEICHETLSNDRNTAAIAASSSPI